jgi:hypothetical protein
VTTGIASDIASCALSSTNENLDVAWFGTACGVGFATISFSITPAIQPWEALTRAFLVTVFAAVGHHSGRVPDILLRLHGCERMPQPFVFDDSRVTDALVFAEDVVGK